MERKSLESAAANYWYLRGLLSIPVGILLIVAAMSNLEWGPFSEIWPFWVAVAAAGAAYLGITRHYNETYGRVTLSRSDHVKAAVATVISAALVGGGVQIDWSLEPPVNATAAAFAVIMLLYYAVGMGLRAHHVLIWGVVLVAGLLPAWGDVGRDSKINVGLILAGVAIIVTGLLDHDALKRSFGEAKGLNLENGNVGA